MWPFGQQQQPMYQQYANHWDQGSYAQIPEQEAQQNYQLFTQNAPPQMVEQAHTQYYQQMPPEQHAGLMQGLVGGLMQRGIDPRQAGIQNTDPYSMSPQESARLTGYVQQAARPTASSDGTARPSGPPRRQTCCGGHCGVCGPADVGRRWLRRGKGFICTPGFLPILLFFPPPP